MEKGFCAGLYHCERDAVIMAAVIFPCIASLNTTNGECVIVAAVSTTESCWSIAKAAANQV